MTVDRLPHDAFLRIGLRYGHAATLSATLALALALASGWFEPTVATAIAGASIGGFVVWIARQDLATFTIPDTAIFAVTILAFSLRWTAGIAAGAPAFSTGLAMVIDAGVPGGLLFLFREIHYRRKGYDGLGFGDVKLAAAGGLLVGVVGFSWALFVASLFGLGIVLAGRIPGGTTFGGTDKLAFGSLLAPALWAVWLLQEAPWLFFFSNL